MQGLSGLLRSGSDFLMGRGKRKRTFPFPQASSQRLRAAFVPVETALQVAGQLKHRLASALSNITVRLNFGGSEATNYAGMGNQSVKVCCKGFCSRRRVMVWTD